MISNLPNDVIHDLLRDLHGLYIGKIECDFCEHTKIVQMEKIESVVKQIIETWEGNREKYLNSIDQPLEVHMEMRGNSDAIRGDLFGYYNRPEGV